MAVTKIGFVVKVFNREGKSSRGAWFAKSFKIADANGTEDPMFFQLGFNVECPFKENDYIQFDAEPKDDKAMTVTPGTGSVVGNPPARSAAAAKPAYAGKKGGGYSPPKPKESALFGQIGGHNTEDDIRRMSMSAARGDAVTLVGILIEANGLPMSEAKGKAGQPKRFEAIMAAVDKLTIKFFFDGATGRLIDTVSDDGVVNVAPDAALPDPVVAEAAPAAAAPAATAPAEAPPPVDDGGSNVTF